LISLPPFSYFFLISPSIILKAVLFLFLQFQSHQIFHVLVVAAAFVHFYGVSNLQEFRYGLEGGCTDDSLL
jgi:predicted membrane channel-forming protein YqfA (hemolysin III family)